VNKDLNDILALTEVSELLRRNGVFNGGGTLDEVQRFLRSERNLWQEAIQKAGIQPE
jgi:tripartite-type tricarboxylate transporter receptor subunit TctC